jgi:hypothetical protein
MKKETPEVSNVPAGLAAEYQFDAEFHGETLHYIESDRRTSMIWTWTNGYRISESSMQQWSYTDGTHRALTEAERGEVIRRAVKYAKESQGVQLIVEP